jgi:hypothetical protein
MLYQALRRTRQVSARHPAGAGGRRPPRTWLQLEPLEERSLPSVAGPDALLNSMAAAVAGYKGTVNDPLNKVGPELAGVYAQYVASQSAGQAALFHPTDPLLRIAGGEVLVDAAASGSATALATDLQQLGGRVTGTYGRLVSGYLPLGQISAFSTLASLGLARPSEMQTNSDPAIQGQQAMYADTATSTYGVNGSGVTVGVMSDSFNNSGNGSYASDIVTGALPSGINVLEEDPGAGTDEGRAMLQVVHGVAPGSGLAFHTAFNGEADFASGIQALATAGCNVIVDDVTYYDETFFQDNAIAQAANSVVGSGHAYYSSAGNEAQQSYEANFVAGNTYGFGAFSSASGAPTFFGGVAHNFNSGGYTDQQTFTLVNGASLNLTFNWQQPNFSISGGSGCQVDMDIYILNSSNVVVAGDASGNIGGDAIARVGYTNTTGSTATYKVMILDYDNNNGATPGRIKYIDYTDGGPAMGNLAFATNSGTIIGHHNAEWAEPVGAAYWGNTPRFGVSPAQLEGFSSSGGVPLLFDTAGNPENYTGQYPEVTAPDGVSTTFFGNFFGTSCAAPDAAGVAALLFQAGGTSTSPFTIYFDIESTCQDMGAPGFDYNSGNGLVRALAAVGTIYPDGSDPQLSLADFTGISNSTPGGSFSAISHIGGAAGSADVDMWSFQATAGSSVTASTSLPGGGAPMDTYMRLFDANGNQLAANDDGNGNLYSLISNYVFAATGTYYLGISGYPNYSYNPVDGSGTVNGSQGDYQLNLSVTAVDPGTTLGTALNTGISNLVPGGTYNNTTAIGDGPGGNSDVDLYAFQATIGSTLTAVTSLPSGGNPMDTELRLFNSSGTELAFNDDANGTLYSQINYTFGATGTYYIGVAGYNNRNYNPVSGSGAVAGSIGDYHLSLNVTSPADIGGTLGTARNSGIFNSSPGGTYTNTAAIGDGPAGNADVDMYQFQATVGSLLTAVTSQPSGGTAMDTELRLFDSSGNELAFNDDANGTFYSQVNYTFTATGTYYIGVAGFNNRNYNPVTGAGAVAGSTGDYTLGLTVAAPKTLSISAPASTTAGAAFSVTVTALDNFGNTATAYTGTVHFTSSDGLAVLPANYTFVAGDHGVHIFANGVTLKTSGSRTVTATDTVTATITGTATVTVNPAAASHFSLSAPASSTAGSAFSVTVTALDQFNNVATGYLGTVHFTSSDGQAVLPANYTFTAGDHGVHTFTNAVTLKTAGSQTVTATDTVTSLINATATVTVSPGPVALFAVSTPSSTTAGVAFTVTVTARDAFGNTVTGYPGTVHFTSSDPKAVLPADYTFVAGDHGVHNFTNGVTLKKAGTKSVTVTDTSNSTITGSHNVKVNPGAATHFKITAPKTSVSGAAFTITVTALDAFANTATGYLGTVHFTSSDGSATLPANYTFVAGDKGKHTFTNGVTLRTVGSRTLTATDTVNGTIHGSAKVNVTAAAALMGAALNNSGGIGWGADLLDAFFAGSEVQRREGVFVGGNS